jgi:ArsR family transcriptional regulator
VQDPLAALREMKRILRTERGGGTALIVDMVEHNREEYRHTMGHRRLGFPEKSMKELLKEAGFERPQVQMLSVDVQSRGPGLFAATGRLPRNEKKRKTK